MTRVTLALLAAGAFFAAEPAGAAAITVLGNNAARLCYEAAEATTRASLNGLGDCDRALAEDPLSARDRVATHVNRGIIRVRKGDVQGSLTDFVRASQLDPNEPEAYLNRALVLTMRANQASEAVPLFTRALEKKTRRPALAFYGRAAANEDLGDLKAAYSDYTNAVSADPKWQAPKVELARFQVRSR